MEHRSRTRTLVEGSSLVGVTALVLVVVGNLAIWLAARPPGQPEPRYLGEVCGVEAVVLFSCALVLATLIPAIETAFGGLDRVALWHRRVAILAMVLLVPHIALVTSPPDPYSTSTGQGLGDVALIGLLFLTLWALAPRLRAARWPGPIQRLARASYEHWLTAHRLTGLFVAVAIVHGAIVDPAMHRSTLLRASFLTIGGIGVVAYVYREVFARFVVPIYDYRIATVERLNDSTLAVSLDPLRSSISFSPGQFVFLAIGGSEGWQRHPFSVASAPSDRRLELIVKAVGDYTRQLYDTLSSGVPAKLAGPFGGFDHQHGGDHQIWIAGGIGITPFLSWIRSIESSSAPDTDFYYSVKHESDAVYLDEIKAAAAHHPKLRTHLVCTDTDGILTAETVMNGRDDQEEYWVFMCGPPPMMHALAKEFRNAGVPARRIRWEQFGER